MINTQWFFSFAYNQQSDKRDSIITAPFLKRVIAPLVIVLASLTSGCTSTTSVELPQAVNWQRALEVPVLWKNHPVAVERNVQLLELTPEMKRFVRTHVNFEDSPKQRLNQLFVALYNRENRPIQYDSKGTFSAKKVFETQRANCLGFSALFVALSREAGLSANFQQVEVPPTWEQRSPDTLVQYQHINVEAGDGNRGWVVDFRLDRFRETYPRRRLSDTEALAHYHGNLGMEKLIAGDLSAAFWRTKLAVEAAPENSSIWANMGIVQRRMGNLTLAEASYLHALDLDPDNHSAMRNLAVVYDEQHKMERANELRKLSDSTRLKNPYFRYALAQSAYHNGDYDDALELLRYALRHKSREHKFHYLRGLSLQALGQNEKAVSSIKRAIRLTDKDFEQQVVENYQSHLDAWGQANG